MSGNLKRARADCDSLQIVEDQIIADLLRSMGVSYDERVVQQLVEVMHGLVQMNYERN